ncbi:MAG: ABC transporter permease, partial [Crocinitomicaceae bacterium]|nr:ABC transporter permease [Crocinitomicaceae bacterium]
MIKTIIVLAWRNLWRNKRRTWITISSVVFAVVLALFLESMDRGSQEGMVRNSVQFGTGYIQIQDTLYNSEPSIDNTLWLPEGLLADLQTSHTEIATLIPRLQAYGLAAADEKSRVVMINGIDAEREHVLNGLQDRLIEGAFASENNQIVIAAGLADYLGLSIGDTMVLLGQGFHGATAAGKYAVSGIVQHPMPEMNQSMTYLSIEAAQWLFDAEQRLTSLIVHPKNPNRHAQLAQTLREDERLKDYTVYTWEELMPELVRTVEFDQVATLIFLWILYVVIGFGIFGTVLTMTLEREKEFGVLISVGMHKWKLALVIFIETLAINSIGVLVGLLISLPVILYFYHNPIPLGEDMAGIMEEYGMDAVLPFSLDPEIFLQQGIIIFIISMVITIYPMARVMGLNVLKAARK